ncbi:Ig-like domain-containing protein [Pseudomonas tolaasii]|uniref:Ig-like domain-containing protein n=1 Tax=Pseudomonas tolaasii TaxID=29442 RepID=UPI0027346F34|nr:Ig-like domain-containing protein [Pseudomonas tolaasii]WLH52163.1 Ig-like domain-containing protein [Pseudomonas tolaasii]
MIMPLEPRMLFDGAVAATVADVAQPDSHPTADAAKTPTGDHPVASKDTHGQADAPAAAPVAVPGQTVVFVDARVKDSASLLQGVAPGTQVVQLDGSKDGLQQIADYLDTHQGVSSVQIIAHGNAGDLWLGTTYLSADNVAARSAVLGQIGKDMNVGGDILIYGCYTAEGERGLNFVDSLAQLTGRDVAASTNRTGVGGDWDLEIATGTIESANVLSTKAMSDYQWGLATWTATNNANTGVGSLRAAIASAQNGDIVTFSSGMTVQLTSELLVNKNITVDGDLNNDGVADVTLDGQYRTRVIEITSGSTVTLDGLVITRGLVSGTGGNGGYGATGAMGGGIFNAGILTLNNVSVTGNAAAGGGGGGGVTGANYGGGGGGGGGLGGQGGGHGGTAGPGTGTLGGQAGSGGVGGYGGGYDATHMGGRGGSTTGGAGGVGVSYYSNGGNGGTANNGTISIGGGGGGSGWDKVGGVGGNAAGGIYNASTGTLKVIGTSVISNNLGAGGGGGGGSGQGSNNLNGGDGGRGVGAIWNQGGTVLITSSNFSAISGNAAGSGSGGAELGGGVTGSVPLAFAAIYNNGGTLNTAYVEPPTATIVMSDTALKIGETSLVTFTFSRAVTGFTNADLTIANGTLTSVSSSDGGLTWTATFTPTNNITDSTNLITLNNTGVTAISDGVAGVGTTSSVNYAIDTARPTVTIVMSDTALKIGDTSLVTFTFSEAVTGFTNADVTIANGTLTAVSSSDGGITWTGTFTPTASITDTTNLITLDNTGIADLAGNAGSGTTDSANYVIDTVRPTATIVVADTNLAVGETSLVTITFSEAVSGFTTADMTVANGTLTGLSSSDGGITWTATLTPTSNITDTTNLVTLDNTGVVDLAGNAGSGTTNSNNYAIDTARPTATIVVADNALKIGETSLVTITFSEAITGFTNADLTIANGTLTAVSSSDGGITWTATFTPTASITDATNLITLNNTGIADLNGNAGSGTTDSNNYAIDTVRPTATIVVADNNLRIGETSLVTITFSEAVSGFTNADLTVANGTLSAVSSSDGGITWTATFTPSASVTDTTNLITLDNTGIVDLSGNAGSGTTNSNNYAIDTQRPTATIVVADSNLTAGETSLVTITFSEAVSGFTNADLIIANGTLTAVSSSDGGITWTATFTPNVGVNDATNLITLANTGIADLAGNAGSGTTNSNNYTIDTVVPTATIIVADTSLKIGENSLVTITFSEAVTGFTNADLTIANGTLSAVSSSDGGITWTATFTPTTSITDATNLITLDNSGVQNLSGNTGIGITNSNNYAIDTVRPTATIVVADTALGVGQTSLVTITFSEAVTGFTNADLTIANGTLSAVSSSDGGITWTATFTPAAGITDTTNLITLDNTGVTDLAGNAGSGTTDSNNYAVDSQRPTATIVLADSQLSAGETSLVTITFSEAVTGFNNADLSVANGTLSSVTSSDGGVTWTATFTPNVGVNDATNLIVLNNTGVTDLAGNAGTGTTSSANYTIDTVLPTATIIISDNALKIGETSLVTITFSEAVTGFTNADLTIANGTLSAVSSSDGGITWTATFTPTTSITDATNLITLDNSGVQNQSGNAGSGTTDSNNYSIDTVRPTASIVIADTALAIGQTSLVTVTFSEAVTGFTNADLTIANGTLSAVSSSDGGITWTATFTPAAGITDTTNLITLDNTGVADLAGNAGSGTTDSNNYAVDSQRPAATIVIADPTLAAGETSLVTITFSEAVSGFDNSDLSVPNGTLTAVSSADGGITWTAIFTPAVNVRDTTNLISLNNTGVTDLAGNAGAGVTNSGNFTIDTMRPTATVVVADTALKAGETSAVTITFSEAVSGFTNADLSVANGTLSNVSSSDGGITWTATFTPTGNITDTTNLITLDNSGVQNLSGNTGVGTTDSNNYSIDTQLPTATIAVADSVLAIGQTTTVTITFSETVSGFDLSDLSVANGVLSSLASADGGKTWTATLTPTASITDATNLIVLDTSGVSDAAGNTGSSLAISNNYAIDGQRPTATINVASPSLAIGQTSLVTITFSEAVSGFDNSDLSVPNGTLSAVSSADGGVTWTATFTPTGNIHDTTNLITLNNAGVTDLAGNAGSGVTDSGNFSIDTLRPTATVVVDHSALKIGETAQVTITFSEAVSGFTTADLSVANGSLSNLASSDGGMTWTATLTPTANITDTSNLITLDNSGVQDAAGNAGSGTTDSNNYAIDTQRPTATITVANGTLGIGQTTTVTIAFSEAVSGFDLSDLSVANGVLSNLASADGGKTWTATLTPTAAITDATNLIVLDAGQVNDIAGNAGSGIAISNNYAIDGERPTATISIANPNLTVGQTTTVTFTFSEKVSGFDLDDLSVANGSLSNLATTDGGKTWTATLTPAANLNDPSNFITLDTSLVTDLSGNAGSGFANSNNFSINTVSLTGDPLFRVTDPVAPPVSTNLPLQPIIFGQPTGNLGSPIGFPPLFAPREVGADLPPIGSIFIHNGASAPSFIAQVFSTDGSGDGSGKGFLGFGGGDGGVFGSSTLSGLFNRETGGGDSDLNAFDNRSIKGQGDPAHGPRGVFGAPTLGQQLQQIKDTEHRQVTDLAHALQQVGISEMQA